MKELYGSDARRMAKVFADLAAKASDQKTGILVFVHRSVDGDCVGSACAACLILRSLGADAKVAMPEELPETMSFMGVDDLLLIPGRDDARTGDYTIPIATDCSEGHRMGDRGELFDSLGDAAVVDHHELQGISGDNKWILSAASSASEMMYYIAVAVSEMTGKPLRDILTSRAAVCLLTGIVTDTGRFTYSNTKPETLEAASVLMELGGSISDVCYNLFDRKRREQFFISNTVCSNAELLAGGKMAVATVTTDMFRQFGAGAGDIDDVVSRLRDIDGVELAICMRELPDGGIRGNLRSKSSFDCAQFAGIYGGGGHKRAAGFTVTDKTMDELYADITLKAEELL